MQNCFAISRARAALSRRWQGTPQGVVGVSVLKSGTLIGIKE